MRADHLRQVLAIYSVSLYGVFMRYARSGRAYAQSRNVFVRDFRVPGFFPVHIAIFLSTNLLITRNVCSSHSVT